MSQKWYFVGCPVCVYSGHMPKPRTHCPNDGMPLMRVHATIKAIDHMNSVRESMKADPVLLALSNGIRSIVAAATV